MRSCEYAYLCGARHFFASVYLDLDKHDFSQKSDVPNLNKRKGLLRKMVQFTQRLDLRVPDTHKAQRSFASIVSQLKFMALSHMRFLPGSILSNQNHEKLLQTLEPGTKLRKRLHETRFSGVTSRNSAGRAATSIDLELETTFKSIHDLK